LRSGGANGADKTFEEGCDLGKGKKEIYLPWKGFNGNQSQLYYGSNFISKDIKDKSFEIAEQYHPNWSYLSDAATHLIARNGFQVLGVDLESPVGMMLYWHPPFKSGGTGQAIRIALDKNIIIFNVGLKQDRVGLSEYIKEDLSFLETDLTYNLITEKWE